MYDNENISYFDGIYCIDNHQDTPNLSSAAFCRDIQYVSCYFSPDMFFYDNSVIAIL